MKTKILLAFVLLMLAVQPWAEATHGYNYIPNPNDTLEKAPENWFHPRS